MLGCGNFYFFIVTFCAILCAWKRRYSLLLQVHTYIITFKAGAPYRNEDGQESCIFVWVDAQTSRLLLHHCMHVEHVLS